MGVYLVRISQNTYMCFHVRLVIARNPVRKMASRNVPTTHCHNSPCHDPKMQGQRLKNKCGLHCPAPKKNEVEKEETRAEINFQSQKLVYGKIF